MIVDLALIEKIGKFHQLRMHRHAILLLCIVVMLFCVNNTALAWSHELSLGYAVPWKESTQHYSYSGVYLNGNLYSRLSADHSLLFTLNTSGGYWFASSEKNNRLTTVALQPTFRAYFSHNSMNYARPYLFIAYGPAYLSNRKFGIK
jgi:hypothetical protein